VQHGSLVWAVLLCLEVMILAIYNNGGIYNSIVPAGGAMYNSAHYAIIVLDYGSGHDSLSMEASITISDSGQGIDGDVLIATAYFFVTEDNDLYPLNLIVLGDSRKDLMPGIREFVEKIPGLHGEIEFGTKLEPRLMELHVATQDGLTLTQREQLKRTIAKHLNPVSGTKTLVFGDELDKTYHVKYAGRIPLDQFPTWFEFTLPFKMSNPYIIDTFERTLIGNGTLTNLGNTDTYLTIEIAGPDTNPSVTIGSETLAYTGAIAEGETLVINTGNLEAELEGDNVLGSITGDISIKLPPGNTTVTADSNVTFKWKSRWV
jgi:predicted phage tail component-like protein